MMITKLTPSDLNLVASLRSDYGFTIKACAEKFDVTPTALSRAIKQYNEHGYSAFAFTCLLEEVTPLCKGKTLSQCHKALIEAGLFTGGSKSLLMALARNNVSYKKKYKDYSINGINGIPAIAKHYGLPVQLIHHRLASGESLKKAVSRPKESIVKHRYKGLNGVIEICEHYGLSRQAINRQLNRGKTISESVEYLLSRRQYQQENQKGQETVA